MVAKMAHDAMYDNKTAEKKCCTITTGVAVAWVQQYQGFEGF